MMRGYLGDRPEETARIHGMFEAITEGCLGHAPGRMGFHWDAAFALWSRAELPCLCDALRAVPAFQERCLERVACRLPRTVPRLASQEVLRLLRSPFATGDTALCEVSWLVVSGMVSCLVSTEKRSLAGFVVRPIMMGIYSGSALILLLYTLADSPEFMSFR